MEENIERKPIKTVSKKSFIITVAALLAVIVALAVGLVLALVLGGNKGENVNNSDNAPSIYESDDGFWVINGVKTNLKTNGEIDNGTVQDENPQGLEFFLNQNGTYTVAVGKAKLFTKIVIPETYKGIPVTEIDAYGFNPTQQSDCPLIDITIPNTITKIGYSAFVLCTNLESIIIPDSIKNIDDYAFSNCSSLKSIVIPDSVTTIGEHAFWCCSNLKSLTIHGLADLGSAYYNAFGYGTPYPSINRYIYKKDIEKWLSVYTGIVGSLHILDDNENEITKLVVPDGVTKIKGKAFYGCKSLTSVVIPDNVTSIGDNAFNECSSLTSIVIPYSVTNIDSYAFSGCTSIASIVIPSSVTSIDYTALYNCTSLTDVYYTGTEEEWAAISIGSSNTPLTNATIHYNYVPEE